jgi:hypothetical protein
MQEALSISIFSDRPEARTRNPLIKSCLFQSAYGFFSHSCALNWLSGGPIGLKTGLNHPPFTPISHGLQPNCIQIPFQHISRITGCPIVSIKAACFCIGSIRGPHGCSTSLVMFPRPITRYKTRPIREAGTELIVFAVLLIIAIKVWGLALISPFLAPSFRCPS